MARKRGDFANSRRRTRCLFILFVLTALVGCRMAPFDLDVSMSAIDDGAPTDLFLLTFDGNGNDGGTPPPANDYPEGHSVTLPDNIGSLTNTTPPGYTFIGWNTQADGL
ncbi:MAG: InlB B-repeat-containing protein, partial [Spirochaetaceae bacterium]